MENRTITWIETGAVATCLAAGAIYGAHGLRDHLESVTAQNAAQSYWDKNDVESQKYFASSNLADQKDSEAGKSEGIMFGFAIAGLLAFGAGEYLKSESNDSVPRRKEDAVAESSES